MRVDTIHQRRVSQSPCSSRRSQIVFKFVHRGFGVLFQLQILFRGFLVSGFLDDILCFFTNLKGILCFLFFSFFFKILTEEVNFILFLLTKNRRELSETNQMTKDICALWTLIIDSCIYCACVFTCRHI